MQSNEVVGSTVRRTARWLWVLYVVLTLICTLGLWLLGMTIFQAVNHAMTTVSTGGFGTENASANEFGRAVQGWITVFMFVCGVSFPLHLALLRQRSLKVLKAHEETWVFVSVLLLAFVGLCLIRVFYGELENLGFGEIFEVLFNVVSIATSTGFAVGDFDGWPVLAHVVFLLLMCLGGCSGSTAGGLKASRLILLFKVLRTEIRRAFRPNLVICYRLNGRTVDQGARGQLFAVLAFAVLAGALGSFLLIALEPGISPKGCFSAVISSLSNAGPGLNEFGPTQNYAGLGSPGMILLALLMILGRLEYIALLVLLSRQLWRRY